MITSLSAATSSSINSRYNSIASMILSIASSKVSP
jgi:hypothetical protein